MCARVCARRVCVKSHPFQLLGTGRGEASASGGCRLTCAGTARWVSELPQSTFRGTAARGAAPSQPHKLRASGWRSGAGGVGVAENRALTCACGATRVVAPRVVDSFRV